MLSQRFAHRILKGTSLAGDPVACDFLGEIQRLHSLEHVPATRFPAAPPTLESGALAFLFVPLWAFLIGAALALFSALIHRQPDGK